MNRGINTIIKIEEKWLHIIWKIFSKSHRHWGEKLLSLKTVFQSSKVNTTFLSKDKLYVKHKDDK